MAHTPDLPHAEQQALREHMATRPSNYMEDLCLRVRDLSNAGWTFQSIADAFDPPRRRSTVRSWVIRGERIMQERPHLAVHVSSIAAQPVPTPPVKKPRGVKNRPKSPGIPHDTQLQIARLAPVARRFRAGTQPRSASFSANSELSDLAATLYAQGVTVSELARAAGVTYRAMKRRVDRSLSV